jgi:hypothetical protein
MKHIRVAIQTVSLGLVSAMSLGGCFAAGEDQPGDYSVGDAPENGTDDGSAGGGSGSNEDGPYVDQSAGGSDGSGAGNGTGAVGDDCGSEEVPSEPETILVPGNVLVVFDRSLSMNNAFETPTGPRPRYVAAGDALLAAFGSVAANLTIGAILFPSTNGLLPCMSVVDPIGAPSQIKFMPGVPFTQAWHQYWAGNGLLTGTPINRAFDKAEEALAQTSLPGKTVVVVFGDGEPTCSDGFHAPDRAAQWLTQGIETYVVGLSGGLGSALLNDVAARGGTGAMIIPSNYQQLQHELANIATTMVTAHIDDCLMTLDPAPPNLDDVHLIVTDSSGDEFEVPRDPGNAEGWTLSADGKTATILGQVCSDARSGRYSKVRFEFGCVDVPILR